MAETNEFRQALTDRLIEQLEAGVAPWQKPWDAREQIALPYNPTTGKSYRGANSLYLSLVGAAKGYADPRWATYRQAADQDWQVRKGEKGVQIEYWKFSEERPLKDEVGKPLFDETGQPKVAIVLLDKPKVFRATVFNAAQMDKIPDLEPGPRQHEWDPLERAETILQTSGAILHHDQRDSAYYSPANDRIHLPARDQFKSAAAYYSTALHELGHWTGHHSRLNRDLSHPFGSPGYAREELRAELASYFLSDRLGIPHNPEQHAAYVKSWIAALREDRNEIFRASRDADRITDFVLGLDRDRKRDPIVERMPEAELTKPSPHPTEQTRPALSPQTSSSGDNDMPIPNDIQNEAAIYGTAAAQEPTLRAPHTALERITDRQRKVVNTVPDIPSLTQWAMDDASDFYQLPIEQSAQAIAIFRENAQRFPGYAVALQDHDPGVAVRIAGAPAPLPPRGMADFEAEITSMTAHRALSDAEALPWTQDDLFLANELLIDEREESHTRSTTVGVTPRAPASAAATDVAQEKKSEQTPNAAKPKRKRSTKDKDTNVQSPTQGNAETKHNADAQVKENPQQENSAIPRAKIHLLQDPAGRHIVAIDQGGLTKAYAVVNNPGIAARTANKLRDSVRSIGNLIQESNLLPDVIKTRFRLRSGEEKVVYNVDPEGVDLRHSQMRDAGLNENDRRNLVVVPEGDPAGSLKRVLLSTELPDDVKKRFVHSDSIPGQYFDRNRKLAFIDKGSRLATDQNAPEIIASMVSVAQAKGWKSITLKGHEDFRREAWLAASLSDIEVKGFKPSEADLARLDSERQLRMGNAIQPGMPGVQALTANEIVMTQPEVQQSLGPDAIALGEVARLKGVREDQIPNFMQAAQTFIEQAEKIGIELPKLKVFDPKAPATPVTISSDKTREHAPEIEISQPSPSVKR